MRWYNFRIMVDGVVRSRRISDLDYVRKQGITGTNWEFVEIIAATRRNMN